MAAHRYWRLLLGRRSGVAALVTEIAMAASIGGADECAGGTALSSTPGAGTAANAFDDNTGTSFQSQVADPAYIGYDFGSAKSIVEIAVTIGATAGTTPYSFIIQYSDDNATWTPVANYDISGAATSSTTTVNGFPEAPDGRLSDGSTRLAPSGPTGNVVIYTLKGVVGHYDSTDGGNYRVAGTVKIDDDPTDLPVHRKVRLFSVDTARCVRETWSDPVTGAYSFDNLKLQPYFVVAHDYLAVFNAVIKDAITPEPMT